LSPVQLSGQVPNSSNVIALLEEAIRAGWTRSAALVEVADLVMNWAIENRKDA
jgi:hypothetical protein